MFNWLSGLFKFHSKKSAKVEKKEKKEYSDFMKTLYALRSSPLDMKTKDYFIALQELKMLQETLVSNLQLRVSCHAE
jgi:hypothetical protein